MSIVTIAMPNGKEQKIDEKTVLVVRELAEIEKNWGELHTDSRSVIYGTNYTIYPLSALQDVVSQLSNVLLAQLSAPNEMPLYVNAERVTDRDDATKAFDDPRTRSVLYFGPGKKAGTVRVRESEPELRAKWEQLGLPTTPFD